MNAVVLDMQFPILIFCQNCERTLKYRSHSNIIVSLSIIVCFYSYKLNIRSTFYMNLMWYIFERVVVSQWSSLFFWYEVQFLLCCWLRQCWSIWHVTILYCSFLFRWSWIKQSAASQTRVLTNKCVLKQSICPWQCQ